VLLTRSPLSPVPKDRFSLDLHVLSAPPAFVLSQDQTLREEWVALERAIFSSSLSSKCLLPQEVTRLSLVRIAGRSRRDDEVST
jgi:hypothetical protein